MTRDDADHIELTDHYTDADTRCAAPGCTEVEDSQHEFVKCEGNCDKRFCGLSTCVTMISALPFCRSCAWCVACAAPATCLDGDGDLVCAMHNVDYSVLGKSLDDYVLVANGAWSAIDSRLASLEATAAWWQEKGIASEIWLQCEGGARLYERYSPAPKAPEPARVIEWPRDIEKCPF